MLNRDEAFARIRGPIAEVEVPEWGDGVAIGIRRLGAADLMRLRELTLGAQDGDDDAPPDPQRDLDITCELLSMGLCDDKGKRLFTAEEVRGWDGLQADILHRLLEEVQRHNGIGEAAAEELEKNCGSGQTSEST